MAKKILAILMALSFVVAFAACGAKDNNTTTTEPDTEITDESIPADESTDATEATDAADDTTAAPADESASATENASETSAEDASAESRNHRLLQRSFK